jgi:hypothetical protein
MAIFVSYSRKDVEVVKALAQTAESAKWEIWYDKNLGGGHARWNLVLQNIRAASVFVFAMSDASLRSKPCRLELDYALALGRRILPVQVGDVASLREDSLAGFQMVRYSPDDDRCGIAVLEALADAARRVRPLADPLPPEPPIPFT